ncbi:MAG: hypothetical protein O2818_05640 [Bacteroidetes bacterium]|nr:hypothetical protein [Bacteroidota bacterium]MDA1336355.1 hypothetical protein [Bacteroidota bacterium]
MAIKALRRKWLTHGGVGCLLIGTGFSITLDASARKLGTAHWFVWSGEGTVGLIVMMSGLAFFGSAVRYLVHMDNARKKEQGS